MGKLTENYILAVSGRSAAGPVRPLPDIMVVAARGYCIGPH